MIAVSPEMPEFRRGESVLVDTSTGVEYARQGLLKGHIRTVVPTNRHNERDDPHLTHNYIVVVLENGLICRFWQRRNGVCFNSRHWTLRTQEDVAQAFLRGEI